MRTKILPTLFLRTPESGVAPRFLAMAAPADPSLSGTGGVCLVLAPHPGLDPDMLAREFGLTPQQQKVAELLWHRRTNAEIAAILDIAMNTVRRHVEAVLFRLGLHCRWDVEPALNEFIHARAVAEAQARRGVRPKATRSRTATRARSAGGSNARTRSSVRFAVGSGVAQ